MVFALAVSLLTPGVLPPMPEVRLHGLARAGGRWWAGGLRGLYRQTGTQWEKIDARAVRQLAARNDEVWVLFGDGSVDKIEPRRERRAVDLLHGKAKRPWTSCLLVSDAGIILGGRGGLLDLRAGKFQEEFSLQKDDVVTALFIQGVALWIGTQQSGVYRWQGRHRQRFGFACGVSDPWITAIGEHRGELVIGTASHGLLAFRSGALVPISSPSQRIRYLDGAIIGTMDGTFGRAGGEWIKEMDGEATFSLRAGLSGARILGSATAVELRP